MPWFLGNAGIHWNTIGFTSLILWSIVWKGLALWHAAKKDHIWWFLAFLVINTAGVLEIGYLLFKVKLFSSTTSPPKKKKAKKI